MPCRGEDYDVGYQESMKKDLDEATRLLCGLCRSLLACGRGHFIEEDPELSEWWENHKEADEARRQRERENEEATRQREEKEARRQAVIDKLTPDQREALDL